MNTACIPNNIVSIARNSKKYFAINPSIPNMKYIRYLPMNVHIAIKKMIRNISITSILYMFVINFNSCDI
ncbi:MAG: hypothetical protein J6D03_01035 [Clostridia bacterium]|nr:hypothetical protein [Clostridia bacterium]